MPTPTVFDAVFIFCVKNRARIISIFKLYYLFLGIILLLGAPSIYNSDGHSLFFYQLGLWLGRTALILYTLTQIPGIFRRFGINHRIPQMIMIFRRYLGIGMFLTVTVHFMFVAGINFIFKKLFFWPLPLFEIASLTAYILLIPMFLTSNDWSVNKLGPWWQRFHNATYIIVGLIFLHTVLQRISIWSVTIGTCALLQAASWIYYRYRMRRVNLPPVV